MCFNVSPAFIPTEYFLNGSKNSLAAVDTRYRIQKKYENIFLSGTENDAF
jgi:hypothetical protein